MEEATGESNFVEKTQYYITIASNAEINIYLDDHNKKILFEVWSHY